MDELIGKKIKIRRRFSLWPFFNKKADIEGTIVDKVRECDGKDYYIVMLPSGEAGPFDPLQKFQILNQ